MNVLNTIPNIAELSDRIDEELRILAMEILKDSNGSYITYICRGCGHCLTSPLGNTMIAEITDQCRECFDK